MRTLWTDYQFTEGATARSLTKLHTGVFQHLKEQHRRACPSSITILLFSQFDAADHDQWSMVLDEECGATMPAQAYRA